MRILFIGDIVGRIGRHALEKVLPAWRKRHEPDFIIANGENTAGGVGITRSIAEELYETGVDVITLGNHTFAQRDAIPLLETDARVLRPANYPPGVPGLGCGVFPSPAGPVGVLSLMGRVFMDPLDDPFRAAETLVPLLRQETNCILIDVHAEATSEKAALAWMVDGQVSAVIGTHTHVQTADERLLPAGTAFITDVGMVGPRDGILGVQHDIIIQRFHTWMPARFELAKGAALVNAVYVDIDTQTGHATDIVRLNEVLDTPPFAK
jgi:metallophosphoesterase (TIGR00282 family)